MQVVAGCCGGGNGIVGLFDPCWASQTPFGRASGEFAARSAGGKCCPAATCFEKPADKPPAGSNALRGVDSLNCPQSFSNLRDLLGSVYQSKACVQICRSEFHEEFSQDCEHKPVRRSLPRSVRRLFPLAQHFEVLCCLLAPAC